MPTRYFTQDELAALTIPLDSPEDINEYDHILLDEHVRILKYTQVRRCAFIADDGKTYAVVYEAPIDTGDYEVGGDMPDNHGWWDEPVEGVEVEAREVTTVQWVPVESGEEPEGERSMSTR